MTENETRREIARTEQQTVNETSCIIDALCVAVVFLTMAQIYL